MAVKKADEYQHNNEDNAFVDSDFLRGGRRSVADRAALYALVSKADQLKENVTIVRIRADSENGGGPTEVLLVDDANIGTSAGWEIYSSGSSTPGTGGGTPASYADFIFTAETDGAQSFSMPAGTLGIDGQPAWYQADSQIVDTLGNWDFLDGNLVVYADTDVQAGDKFFGRRYYGGAPDTGGDGTGGDTGTGDIDVNRLVGIVPDENLPPLTPEKVAQLTTLVNEENAQRGPFKLMPAALLDTPEDGALEYNGANVYITVGTVRKLLI
jgi:hypothetical protein